ncbi:c-di-GMP-binding flagellar brake protein YcgR [Natronobacillus azotifigens]|uniref:Flagellar brake domain-containing protein n=1 Tax=Natronobacillus azotifigens TaxID=472978 RepID=A0A9J6R906_9BACI|nr:flagellar brake domain-containing protein [Natronobacillus azotifigens]MCZ0701846.1 flagellar brake domain-containing protein [Natronobacillus azotifigens]
MIKIGTNLTLEREGPDGVCERYRCRIVELKSHTIYIDYPINVKTGRTDIFPKGSSFSAYFVGEHDSVYTFETEIKGKKKNKIPMLLLHIDFSKIQKIQRREYVRVDANLDVSVHHPENNFLPFTSLTTDISGGGLAILLPENHKMKAGQLLAIWIVIPTTKASNLYVSVEAEAIRIHEKNHQNKQLLSVKFKDIGEKDRDKIIQFCFDTQLKERRNQLESGI